MDIASEMIDENTRMMNEQRQSDHTVPGSSACIDTDTTMKDNCVMTSTGKRKHQGVFKPEDAEALVKSARKGFKCTGDQDMQASQVFQDRQQVVPSKPRGGRVHDVTSEVTRVGLRRNNGDAAVEFGGIPIAGECTDDESTSDDSDDDFVLARGDMTPEELIRVLRRGAHVG